MPERNENNEPAEHDHPADVLTGEDVVLEDEPFVEDLTGTIDDVADEAAPAPLDDLAIPEPQGAPEPEAPALPELPPEPEIAAEPEGAEELPADIPVEAIPLESGFPETSRVDTASADDLADSTSVLNADFFASAGGEAESPLRDVLQGRDAHAVVGEDGESLVTIEPPTEVIAGTPLDEKVDTTVMRRSLINQPTVDQVPSDPQETLAFDSAVPATDTRYAPVAHEVPLEPAFAAAPGPRADSGLLEGATILPTVPSRAGSRLLSAIGTILLVPIAWYLLTDSAVRLVLAVDNPWTTGQVNLAALGEMAGGLSILLLIAVLATQSSLGLFLAGIGLLILGLPFLILPELTSSALETFVSGPLLRLGAFGQNLYFHLTMTGATGILFMSGFALVLGGWVAFKLRRTGRGEESLRAEVAAINPEGIRARWARKATENAAGR